MKKLIFLLLLVFAKPVFSQALQSVTSVVSDGRYLKLTKSTGEVVGLLKKNVKLERNANVIILYDNSLSDHLITGKDVTLYALYYASVTAPSTGSASALLTAVIALINL